MSLSNMFAYGRSLSIGAAATKAFGLFRRQVGARWREKRHAAKCTFVPRSDTTLLSPPPETLAGLSDAAISPHTETFEALAARYVAHRFDLLGSGWVEVRHGMSCAGFDGHAYPPGQAFDVRGNAAAMLSPGNRDRARAIGALISPDYMPIDWQIDYRSGYRWCENRWSATLMYGHEPGVDIKVPWELARLQHLPLLALAARRNRLAAGAYRQECRDQILDFIAANPPGYGVNWVCAMDVALRAANMVVTHWLLASDARPPGEDVSAFERELSASLLAHGRFIMDNLEWSADFRGNHYLADVCGLLFIAAGLQPSEETDAWWAFARREVLKETERQFGPDGGNFEASTCYHRLSAEMVTYATALILGRDGADTIPTAHAELLRRIARFSADVTKPDGHVAQIGDNDNGRMFKLCPAHFSSTMNEDHLDHRGLAVAIDTIIDTAHKLPDGTESDFLLESEIVAALANGRRLPNGQPARPATSIPSIAIPPSRSARVVETAIRLPDSEVLHGLEAFAYPDFGVYIWKSARFFMAIRCGSIGQNGRGGHAHNDQLAIEFQIDGNDWLADPGTYTYTAAPHLRDAYRSVTAHAAPRQERREPAALNLGMFRLADTARGECLQFDRHGFEGRHFGFGEATYRAVRIETACIRIRDADGGAVDWDGPAQTTRVGSADALRRHFGINLAFSPGYGSVDDS